MPVVARGAGTSLSGGALPAATRRRAVAREVPPHPRRSTRSRARPIVQPGVRNLAISEAARRHGLYYAPDPSSQIACSIGGNVAENAGGVHCLKYGLTVHNVRRVRGVTIEGDVIELGGDALDAPGYDLLALITGSEGLLAVITEITVKLLPKPQVAQVALAAFDDLEQRRRRRRRDHRAGIIPSRPRDDGPGGDARGRAVRARELSARRRGGPAGRIRRHRRPRSRPRWRRSAGCWPDAGATEIRVSRDEAQRLLYWSGRKAAFPAVGRISPDYYCIDGTIPRAALPRVLKQIEAWSQRIRSAPAPTCSTPATATCIR